MFFWSHVAIVVALVGSVHAAPPGEDETTIRTMVDQAVKRLNKGDLTALEEFWDEGADYVGVDDKLIKGRAQIQALFRKAAGKTGQQTATIEQIRFEPSMARGLSPALAMERARKCLRSREEGLKSFRRRAAGGDSS
jgi:hypothetical protein